MECVKRNAKTEYGQRYQFNKINSIKQFQEAVPVVSYPEISNYIEKIEEGKTDILFAGRALAFEQTSGSTYAQKLIPYSKESLNDFRRAILPWLSDLINMHQIQSGSAYWSISPATRQPEVTKGGVSIGLPDAAYLGEDLIPFFVATSAVPPWVGCLTDVHDWQLATLYHLVCNRELALISVWSPTFLLSLLDGLGERQRELVNGLQNGLTVNGEVLSPAPVALKPLNDFYDSNALSNLWPDLKVISCWADASSQPFYQQLSERFPGVHIQAKGLLLTEGVVTAPNHENQTVLTADSGFYEFLDASGNIILPDELVEGESYEVLITTANGLYRYRTFDKVVCDGVSSDLPVLQFIGRSDLFSDLVGEKLTEDFVASCLQSITGFRMLIPCRGDKPGYLLVLDKNSRHDVKTVLNKVSASLLKNPQYAHACKVGQLSGLKSLVLVDPLKIFLNGLEKTGVRLGDIKVPALCVKTDIFDVQIGTAA